MRPVALGRILDPELVESAQRKLRLTATPTSMPFLYGFARSALLRAFALRFGGSGSGAAVERHKLRAPYTLHACAAAHSLPTGAHTSDAAAHTWLLPTLFLATMGARFAVQQMETMRLSPRVLHVALHTLIAEMHERHHHGYSRWHNLLAASGHPRLAA